ncbi:MAG: cytochrome c [Paracoccaceae bacterium]|nr:cytochrome c [Paracoccaceae bacterium]
MPRLAAIVLIVLTVCAPETVRAQEREFTLAAPAELIDSGLLNYILPRFSLKTSTRVSLVEPGHVGTAIFTEIPEGIAVFGGPGRVWHIVISDEPAADSANATRFLDWLTSEVGRKTINAFRGPNGEIFAATEAVIEEAAAPYVTGDPDKGAVLSMQHCGRCHAVTRAHRKNSIGSTPSFAALRALPDWEDRFSGFFVRNPHPAFTAIKDVTLPFSDNRPPPIFPLVITGEDLDDILAFVAGVAPADLGAPIQYQ